MEQLLRLGNFALRNSCACAFCQFLIFHSDILSILFILSQFSAEIAMETLVPAHDFARGFEECAE